jgi:hypothetical protein
MGTVLSISLLVSGVSVAQSPVSGSEPASESAALVPPVTSTVELAPVTTSTPCPPLTMATKPDEGITVSLLNGQGSLRIFGWVSAIGQFSTTRPIPSGGALFLVPRTDTGNNTNTFDLHARQSAIGASFTGPKIGGLTSGIFFLGYIQNDNLTADAYGFLPFNAYGELKNDDWRFSAGLQRDVFNPLTPTTISLLNLFASGNTGSFRGQVRVERFLKPSDALQVTGQFSLGEPVASVLSDNRVLEDNGWPNLEGRLAIGLGEFAERAGGRRLRGLEIGVSGVVGQIRNSPLLVPGPGGPAPRSVADVRGLGLDLHLAMGRRFGVFGELHVGQGLGEYSGAIGQTFQANTLGVIRSGGGWGEAYWYLTDQLHLHAGFGADLPAERDLAPTQIVANRTWFTNLTWDVNRSFQLSVQVDYRQTEYQPQAFRNADGVLFFSQALWKF